MALEVASDLAQLQQFLRRKQTGLGPGGVQQGRRVAFRQNKAVVIMILGIFRVVAHVPEEEGRDEIRRGTAGGGVTAARRRGCRNRVNAQLVGDTLNNLGLNVIHNRMER